MDKTLKELRELREETKREIATKMICIVEYCKLNGFDNTLHLDRLKTSDGDSGVYLDMLVIDTKSKSFPADDDAYSIGLSDIERNDVDALMSDICADYKKRVTYNGHGSTFYFHREPDIKQCKKWIDNIISKLAILQKKEIEELKSILADFKR